MAPSELDRALWILEDHSKRLSAGAESFSAMRASIEHVEKRAMRWLVMAAFTAASAVASGAWWASQRSSSIESTGRVVNDLRQDVGSARRELVEARRALDRVTQALTYQAERDARQDAEIQRLEKVTGRR